MVTYNTGNPSSSPPGTRTATPERWERAHGSGYDGLPPVLEFRDLVED